MQNETPTIQQDTIDLRELFAILKKRKLLIAVVTGLLTLLAIIYAFFIAKPVYEVKAMIEIGVINNKPIDNINSIQQKLSYVYKVNKKDIKRELPMVKSISAAKKSDNILSLIIQGNNNEEAAQYIQTVIKKIETEYKEKTNTYTENQKKLISLTREAIEENTQSITLMEKEVNTYSQKIISLTAEDAALAGIYVLQIGQKQTELQGLKKYISALKTKEEELKLSITPVMMKSTHIVGEIETLENPIEPKKKLIVIVAFITGLMLSVFLAFFLEFLAGMRREEESV